MKRNVFLLIFLFCFFCQLPLHASLPFFHLAMAEKWLEMKNISKEEERKEFILGTLFPDIRYLKELTRRETHDPYPSLAKVESSSSLFEAGKIFHAWVDVIRECYLSRHQTYEKLSFLPPKQRGVFLKFLEDEFLFSKSSWQEEMRYLEGMSQDETQMASESSVKKWHFFLRKYLAESPSSTLSFFCLSPIHIFGVSKKEIAPWKEEIYRCREDLYWKKHVQDLTTEIEGKMKRFLTEKK